MEPKTWLHETWFDLFCEIKLNYVPWLDLVAKDSSKAYSKDSQAYSQDSSEHPKNYRKDSNYYYKDYKILNY